MTICLCLAQCPGGEDDPDECQVPPAEGAGPLYPCYRPCGTGQHHMINITCILCCAECTLYLHSQLHYTKVQASTEIAYSYCHSFNLPVRSNLQSHSQAIEQDLGMRLQEITSKFITQADTRFQG